jgi:hypothetical protein
MIAWREDCGRAESVRTELRRLLAPLDRLGTGVSRDRYVQQHRPSIGAQEKGSYYQ